VGPEFGEDEGKTIIIVCALYGLKSSGAAWRSHFAKSLQDLSCNPTYTDPNVWMVRPAYNISGDQYYEYIWYTLTIEYRMHPPTY
jgi:hypothetical protein